MPLPTFSGYRRLSKTHKLSAAGVAAAGVAAMVFAVVPAADAEQGAQSSQALSAKRVAEPQTDKVQKESLVSMPSGDEADADAGDKADTEAKKAAEAKKANAESKKAAEEQARQKKAAEDMSKKKEAFAAKAKANQQRAAKEAANRSQARKPAPKPAAAPGKYANNLDGWIREALDIMKQHNIPGSYQGIHRNIMRESGGNPRAINNYDINAQNGVPSKGLLQVIKPTWDAYHVPGTSNDQYDPVANIVTACNYAADRYGSMDNVNSAY